MSDWLSFHLSDTFVARYDGRPVEWGFPCGGGNNLGELTWLTKYSRLKEDGSKESWQEGCRRVVEGVYSILKDHCRAQRTPWNAQKAQRSAEEMYELLFTLRWTPPGRGLWMMGSEFVFKHGSAALQNCAFVSTAGLSSRNPVDPFVRLMEMSMLGIGVGFDTAGAGKLHVFEPVNGTYVHVVADSRQGWCASQELLLRSYLTPGQHAIAFDYSQVRPAGAAIKSFGGHSAGPGPLHMLHRRTEQLLKEYVGREIDSSFIVDLFNLEGKCVVAASVRRSAELALGSATDTAFLDLKLPGTERMGPDGWGFMSNNSVIAEVGGDYLGLIPRIIENGEPGLYYRDLARGYGRLADPRNDRDYRAAGTNPCAEQTLENMELCTLVETFPSKHNSYLEFTRTLKVAYLYAKAVTLLQTHWPDSNEVMMRNRRIGCSVSGLAEFVETRGWQTMRRWLDDGYQEIARRDRAFSEWLGVRESIKMTSVKPSGTVSLLAGVTPGVHWPEATDYLRRMRFRMGDPMIKVFSKAGYHVEPDVMDPANTVVVTFPVAGPRVRTVRAVSIWEKVQLACELQRLWADNSVSATFSFTPEERNQIGPLIEANDGRLKSMSFMPLLEVGGAYAQMPYERVTTDQLRDAREGIKKIDYRPVYRNGRAPEGEKFCTNDTCEV